MDILRDGAGRPDPEHDRRDVPLAVMAKYLGIHSTTLYQAVRKGRFPKEATIKHGKRTYFRPWLWVREREAIHV